MSRKKIDRLEVIRVVFEGRLSQVKARQMMGLSARQVRGLCVAQIGADLERARTLQEREAR